MATLGVLCVVHVLQASAQARLAAARAVQARQLPRVRWEAHWRTHSSVKLYVARRVLLLWRRWWGPLLRSQ